MNGIQEVEGSTPFGSTKSLPSALKPAIAWALAILIAAFASFVGIGSHGLWTPDEPRDAAIGKAMLASGDWLVPRLNGQPFLEKPPLGWWAMALGYRALGTSDAVARVASAGFSLATLLLVFAVARRQAGDVAGLLGLAVLATTAQFSADMHRAIVDPPLVLFIAVAHVAIYACRAAATSRGGALAVTAAAIAIALAFLAKGWIGPILGGGPPAIAWLVVDRRRAIRPLVRVGLASVLGLALVGLPWALALERAAGWPALRETLVANALDRIFRTAQGRKLGHQQPIWYYLEMAPVAILPWLLALPAFLRARPWRGPHGDAVRFFGLAALAGVVLLSLPSGKRALYLVPLLPSLALALGLWLAGIDGDARDGWARAARASLLGGAALLPLLLWGVTAYASRGAAHGVLALWAARWSGAGLLAFGIGAVLWAAGLGAYGWRMSRQRRPAAMLTLALLYLVLFGAVHSALAAAIDPLKDLHALTAELSRQVPGDGPILAYQANESLLGIVQFDLGRRVDVLAGPEDLAARLAGDPAGRVALQVEQWRKLPESLRAGLRLVYDETGRRASPYAIAAVR